MYEEAWYSFVPDLSGKRSSSSVSKPSHHRRKESLLQQPNEPIQTPDTAEPLATFLEEAEDPNGPPEATLARRAKSYSDFYDIVRIHLSKEAPKKSRKKRKDKAWEALGLPAAPANATEIVEPLALETHQDELLDASQQEYILYRDQLAMTERHLGALIEDTDGALNLLASLSSSFKAVDEQTRSFKSQCEDLISERRRLQKLADEVGTDLHYYAYLDNITRRLNAPGASRLVDDEDFGDVLDHLDSCIKFMTEHTTYRDAESYLARYQALLTKALHLLEVGLTSRLEKMSAELSKQIAGTQSESARHAIAYGRFEELAMGSDALISNVQKVVRKAYDDWGSPVSRISEDIYLNTANNMFHSYLGIRDRDLKPIVQRDVDEFKTETKNTSVETASRSYIKQCFERSYDEAGLFVKIFSMDPVYSTDSRSAYATLKATQRLLVSAVNIAPIAVTLQPALQASDLQTVCTILEWVTNEYLVLDYGEDEGPFARHCREATARLLAEHLWTFTDSLFEAEITKSISKSGVVADALKIGPVVNGMASSNAYTPVKRALDLLVMFDQAMPKERCQMNSPVVFRIIRETIQALHRAEARLKSNKTGTDSDLFMIKNLLMLKNELLSLEIGDVRNQAQAMEHFEHIWEAVLPRNLIGYFASFIPGSLWGRGSPGPAPPTNAKSQPDQDASEQLDELLRQSIYSFTKRWGATINDARGKKTGGKNLAKVERDLEEMLQMAFSNQPEVIEKLKEAIQINAQAQQGAHNGKPASRITRV